MVHFNLCKMGSRTFALTVSDIDETVPSSTRRHSKNMYLFNTYKPRETQDFGDRQMYRYSCPEVRRTS